MNATPTTARPSTKPADRAAPHVRIPVNLDLSSITPPHLKMLLILEAFWGDKTYCWPSNETLAKKFGCSVSRARQILYEMEELGYIYLLPADERKPHGERAGIFAHSRLNPDRPVEDRPPLRGHRSPLGRSRQVARCGRPTLSEFRQPTLSESCKTPCRNSDTFERVFVIVEPEAFRTTGRFARSTTTKRPSGTGASYDNPRSGVHPGPHPPIESPPVAIRPEPARIALAPAAETPVVSSPVTSRPNDQAGAVETLTDGQREALANLDEGQRTRLDAMSPGKRAAFLAPHEGGFDRAVFDFWVRSELKTAPPPPPCRPLPATVEELIEQLPGCRRIGHRLRRSCWRKTLARRKTGNSGDSSRRLPSWSGSASLRPMPCSTPIVRAWRPPSESREPSSGQPGRA